MSIVKLVYFTYWKLDLSKVKACLCIVSDYFGWLDELTQIIGLKMATIINYQGRFGGLNVFLKNFTETKQNKK